MFIVKPITRPLIHSFWKLGERSTIVEQGDVLGVAPKASWEVPRKICDVNLFQNWAPFLFDFLIKGWLWSDIKFLFLDMFTKMYYFIICCSLSNLSVWATTQCFSFKLILNEWYRPSRRFKSILKPDGLLEFVVHCISVKCVKSHYPSFHSLTTLKRCKLGIMWSVQVHLYIGSIKWYCQVHCTWIYFGCIPISVVLCVN
jgi:hypothetical protein